GAGRRSGRNPDRPADRAPTGRTARTLSERNASHAHSVRETSTRATAGRPIAWRGSQAGWDRGVIRHRPRTEYTWKPGNRQGPAIRRPSFAGAATRQGPAIDRSVERTMF